MIVDLKQQVKSLHEDLNIANIDSDRKSVALLTKVHLHLLTFCIYVRTVLKGHSGAELHIYFLVHLESIYYEIFFYSKIVPNCAVAK